MLLALWVLLGIDTLMEFKSVSRPYRRGALMKLMAYGALYHSLHPRRLGATDLTLVMVTPRLSVSLRNDLATMGWKRRRVAPGYYRIEGTPYPTFVVALDTVARVEHDEFLGMLGHTPGASPETRWWFLKHLTELPQGTMTKDLEGYEEAIRKIFMTLPPHLRLAGLDAEQRLLALASLEPEQRLAGLNPEQRLAGLDPEQRLAGLDPEQRLVAFSDETLRALSEEYIAGLSPAVREVVRARRATPIAAG